MISFIQYYAGYIGTCLSNSFKLKVEFFIAAVRAGTDGDEAGIWAGDLVGICLFCPLKSIGNLPVLHKTPSW